MVSVLGGVIDGVAECHLWHVLVNFPVFVVWLGVFCHLRVRLFLMVGGFSCGGNNPLLGGGPYFSHLLSFLQVVGWPEVCE